MPLIRFRAAMIALYSVVATAQDGTDSLPQLTATFPPRIVGAVPLSVQSLVTWLNVAAQPDSAPKALLALVSSAPATSASLSMTLADDSNLIIDTAVLDPGLQNPLRLWLHEWLLLAVAIEPGRNVTTTIILPDGSLQTKTQRLRGDFLTRDCLCLNATNATFLAVGGPRAYLSGLRVYDTAVGPGQVAAFHGNTGGGPHQQFSSAFGAGGQTFNATPLTIRCSTNHTVIANVLFASFGRPLGVYPDFLVNPACHAPSSAAYVADRCVGASSCELAPDPGLLGDPCPGWRTNLAVAVQCVPSLQRVPQHVLACNITLEVATRNATLIGFERLFAAAANITSDHVLFVTGWPGTVMQLTFTLIGDRSRSARHIANEFVASMLSAQSPFRAIPVLQEASVLAVTDVDMIQCGPGQYAFSQGGCGNAGNLQSQSTSGIKAIVLISITALLLGISAAAIAAGCCISRSAKRAQIKIDPPDDASLVTLASQEMAPRLASRDAVSIQILTPPRAMRSGPVSNLVIRLTKLETSNAGSMPTAPTLGEPAGPSFAHLPRVEMIKDEH